MRRNGRVLVVDDDPAALQTLAHLLRHFGFEVVSEKDSPAAERLLAEPDEFAVLVCDFEMPAINGADLARHSKQLRPNMPVFIFSGVAPTDTHQAPWDGWFLKGIAITELISKLQTLKPAGVEGTPGNVTSGSAAC